MSNRGAAIAGRGAHVEASMVVAAATRLGEVSRLEVLGPDRGVAR